MPTTDNVKPDVQKSISQLKERIKNRANKYNPSPEMCIAPTCYETDRLFKYGPPVSPREFIDSPEFGNNSQRRVVYPWVADVLSEIFSGKYYAPKYQTAAIVAAKGSGKSYLSGWALSYLWYWYLNFNNFGAYLKEQGVNYDSEQTVAFIMMAQTQIQARRVVFDYTTKAMKEVKFIRDHELMPDPKAQKELRYNLWDEAFKRDFTKLLILPGNSSQTFTLGYNIFAGVIDEATNWKEKHTDPAEDLFNEMRQRQFSRFGNNGLILLISSANIDDDYVERLEEEALSNPSVYFKRLSLYDCKPEYKDCERFDIDIKRERADGTIESITLHPPLQLKPLYENHLTQTLRDVESIPSVAGKPFYPDYMLLISRVNRSRQDPAPDAGKDHPEGPMDVYTKLPPWFRSIGDAQYHIHVDLAKGTTANHCGCGFAMCHKQAHPTFGHIIVLDLAVRFKTPKDKELNIGELLEFIKLLKISRGFNIKKVTFDKWNSLQPIQTVNSWNMGIVAEELSVGYKEHTYLKTLINVGQFDFYEDQNLIYELKRLEDYQTFVDHAPGAFKDEADSVAGAAYNAAELMESKEIVKPRAICGALVSMGGKTFSNGGFSGPNYRSTSPTLGKYRQNGF
jgi:hypothetical protein